MVKRLLHMSKDLGNIARMSACQGTTHTRALRAMLQNKTLMPVDVL